MVIVLWTFLLKCRLKYLPSSLWGGFLELLFRVFRHSIWWSTSGSRVSPSNVLFMIAPLVQHPQRVSSVYEVVEILLVLRSLLSRQPPCHCYPTARGETKEKHYVIVFKSLQSAFYQESDPERTNDGSREYLMYSGSWTTKFRGCSLQIELNLIIFWKVE